MKYISRRLQRDCKDQQIHLSPGSNVNIFRGWCCIHVSFTFLYHLYFVHRYSDFYVSIKRPVVTFGIKTIQNRYVVYHLFVTLHYKVNFTYRCFVWAFLHQFSLSISFKECVYLHIGSFELNKIQEHIAFIVIVCNIIIFCSFLVIFSLFLSFQ